MSRTSSRSILILLAAQAIASYCWLRTLPRAARCSNCVATPRFAAGGNLMTHAGSAQNPRERGVILKALPRFRVKPLQYSTASGIRVSRAASRVPFKKGLKPLLRKLDSRRGIYLSSGYEYPERYSRWDIASICPPIEIVAHQRDVAIRPLNHRGKVSS